MYRNIIVQINCGFNKYMCEMFKDLYELFFHLVSEIIEHGVKILHY